jgi:hypothetical protein
MNYYVVTFGFSDPDGGDYQVTISNPILAEDEDTACILLKDQFEAFEGIDCEVFSVKLITN